ncbi:hypothetical protein WJX72_006350 [[Myrmecia] bisecta]|uniref:TIR domain-containing protein n=1 Tax=[Myrmecia] bisecta TaxID=41462 RepID=A0AAW1R851_9CHLO
MFGDYAWQEKFETAMLGVVVISPDFVRGKYTMAELHLLLEKHSMQPAEEPTSVFPIFYGLTIEQCIDQNTFRALYDADPWVGGTGRPDPDVLDMWARDIETLCKICCSQPAEDCHYDGRMPNLAAEAVIAYLRSIGRLPAGYHSSAPVGANLLARKTTPLFGREEELQLLHAALQGDPGKQGCAAFIWGGAGAGKSALAMEAGMHMWETGELPGGAYCFSLAGTYLHKTYKRSSAADSERLIVDRMHAALQRTRDVEAFKPHASLDDIEIWLQSKSSGLPLLILFENAEEVFFNDETAKGFFKVWTMLKTFSQAKLLVTTRKTSALQGATELHLRMLGSSSAVVVGSLIHANTCTAQEAIDQARHGGLMNICGHYAPTGLTQLPTVPIQRILDMSRSLEDFRNCSLLEEAAQPSQQPGREQLASTRYILDPLVSEILGEDLRFEHQQETSAVYNTFVRWMYTRSQQLRRLSPRSAAGYPASWLFRALSPEAAAGNPAEAKQLIADYLSNSKKLPAMLAQRQGDFQRSAITPLVELAHALEDWGQTDDAAATYTQVLEIRQQLLGAEHPDTLASMNDLAVTFSTLGQPGRAAETHGQVLEVRERVLGPEHPDTLTSMYNLACALSALGQLKRVTALHQQAYEARQQVLRTRQRVLGAEHPDTLTSMGNAALILAAAGQLEAADVMYREILEVRQRSLSAAHPDTLASASNMEWISAALQQVQSMAGHAQQCMFKMERGPQRDALAYLLQLVGIAFYREGPSNGVPDMAYPVRLPLKRKQLAEMVHRLVRLAAGWSASLSGSQMASDPPLATFRNAEALLTRARDAGKMESEVDAQYFDPLTFKTMSDPVAVVALRHVLLWDNDDSEVHRLLANAEKLVQETYNNPDLRSIMSRAASTSNLGPGEEPDKSSMWRDQTPSLRTSMEDAEAAASSLACPGSSRGDQDLAQLALAHVYSTSSSYDQQELRGAAELMVSEGNEIERIQFDEGRVADAYAALNQRLTNKGLKARYAVTRYLKDGQKVVLRLNEDAHGQVATERVDSAALPLITDIYLYQCTMEGMIPNGLILFGHNIRDDDVQFYARYDQLNQLELTRTACREVKTHMKDWFEASRSEERVAVALPADVVRPFNVLACIDCWQVEYPGVPLDLVNLMQGRIKRPAPAEPEEAGGSAQPAKRACHVPGCQIASCRRVVIYHAPEDRESVAEPLCAALSAIAITAVADQDESALGQSISQTMQQAVRSARGSVVLLSEKLLCGDSLRKVLELVKAYNAGLLPNLLPVFLRFTREEGKELLGKLSSEMDKQLLAPFLLDQGGLHHKDLYHPGTWHTQSLETLIHKIVEAAKTW